jgi:hypothetical protein
VGSKQWGLEGSRGRAKFAKIRDHSVRRCVTYSRKKMKTSIQGFKKIGGFAASSGQLPDPYPTPVGPQTTKSCYLSSVIVREAAELKSGPQALLLFFSLGRKSIKLYVPNSSGTPLLFLEKKGSFSSGPLHVQRSVRMRRLVLLSLARHSVTVTLATRHSLHSHTVSLTSHTILDLSSSQVIKYPLLHTSLCISHYRCRCRC